MKLDLERLVVLGSCKFGLESSIADLAPSLHQPTRENSRDRFDTEVLDPLIFVRSDLVSFQEVRAEISRPFHCELTRAECWKLREAFHARHPMVRIGCVRRGPIGQTLRCIYAVASPSPFRPT